MNCDEACIRNAEASKLAEAICFLASDNDSYVNGEIMNVDGGWSCL